MCKTRRKKSLDPKNVRIQRTHCYNKIYNLTIEITCYEDLLFPNGFSTLMSVRFCVSPVVCKKVNKIHATTTQIHGFGITTCYRVSGRYVLHTYQTNYIIAAVASL